MEKISLNKDFWKNKLEDELKLRGFSSKTIKAYSFNVEKYLKSCKQPKQYLLDLINKGYATETVRQACFAIKFFLKINKKDDKNIEKLIKDIPNLKREKRLPVILSKKEIWDMIFSTKNLNHRLIIKLGYSTGLRLSEIINLKWPDIDFQRNVIHIKKAKGKKDRIVMLSPKIKKDLRNLTTDKEGFIFKTMRGRKYSGRTIQLIIKNSAKKADIKKKVTPHTLRHSFATHLLEQGIDIRYIRDLLGHSRIETTMIYTSVSKRNIDKIKSPIDF